ncbi:MAG: hypothetical protein VCD33_03280 [Alphaproteobacteria bacterium]|jgi:hypothetical protein
MKLYLIRHADSILHLAHHSIADTRVMGLSVLRYSLEIAIPGNRK